MPWLPALHTEAEDLRFFASELTDSVGWAVEYDAAVVGFAITRRGWLSQLYVLPEWQRRGVGTALLGVALSTSPDPLELWVFARNEAAREFYRGHGFTEVERTDGAGNEEREPDVRLRAPEGRSRVQIRVAGVGDVEGIARAHVASWQGAYRVLLPPAELDALDWRFRAERWSSQLADPGPVRVLVADVGGRVVGFCAVGPARDDDLQLRPERWFELYSIYLVPAWWGAGVGRRLWAAARSAIPAETSAVALWVLEGNVRARAFYERLGFRADGTSRCAARLGTSVSEIRFVWTISSD